MDNKIGLRQDAGKVMLAQKQSVDIDALAIKIYTSLPSVVRAIIDGTMQAIR
jgi:hypothetical protein